VWRTMLALSRTIDTTLRRAHTEVHMYTRPFTAHSFVLWILSLGIITLLAVVAIQLDAQIRTSHWNLPGFGHGLAEGMARDLVTLYNIAMVLLAALMLLGGRHWLLIVARVVVFAAVASSALWAADLTSAEGVPLLVATAGALLFVVSWRLRMAGRRPSSTSNAVTSW